MNPVKIFGKGVTYLGFGALFAMSIVGSIAIDLVILAAIIKTASRNHRHGDNSFATGFLWGIMFSSNHNTNRNLYENAGLMMIMSPVLTGIAVILSIALSVPEVGVLLVAGWAGAFAILTAGIAIHAFGEVLGDLTTWLIDRGQRVTHTPSSAPRPAARDTFQRSYQDEHQSNRGTQPPTTQQGQRAGHNPRFFPESNSVKTPSAPPTPSAPWDDQPPPYSAYA